MARSSRGLALAVSLVLAGPVTAAFQSRRPTSFGHTISGRISNPHQLNPEDLALMLGRREGSSSVGFAPVRINSDGSFVTRPLEPDIYVLRLVRNFSNAKPETLVGLTTLALGDANLSNVTVEVRQNTALTGLFRMESDDPNAVWPPHISVGAWLVFDEGGSLDSAQADGAPGGKFILRNAFGPRVLRCGYTLAPGSKWWPSRVLLDGVDVTDVPTDFSAHDNGNLEVWFTQHPARIIGTVMDTQGRPLRAPWVFVAAADPSRRQTWSSLSKYVQGNTRGEFSIAVSEGNYLVAAAPQETFTSYQNPWTRIAAMTSDGMPVHVAKREIKRVTVPLVHLR